MLNYKSVSQKNTLTCSVIPLLLQNWPKTVANILKGTSSQGSFLCISDDQNKRYGNNIYKSKF